MDGSGGGSGMFSATFARSLMRMLIDSSFHDVTFVVGSRKERIGCCKALLRAHCPVFDAMFTSAMVESSEGSEIPLPNVDPIVFRTMLAWMTSDRLRLQSITSLQPLISLADYYQIQPLLKSACQFVNSSTITIHVITDGILGSLHGIDLGLCGKYSLRNSAMQVRILRDSCMADVCAAIASKLGVPSEKLQLWRSSTRKNGTFRTNRFLKDLSVCSTNKEEATPHFDHRYISMRDPSLNSSGDDDEMDSSGGGSTRMMRAIDDSDIVSMAFEVDDEDDAAAHHVSAEIDRGNAHHRRHLISVGSVGGGAHDSNGGPSTTIAAGRSISLKHHSHHHHGSRVHPGSAMSRSSSMPARYRRRSVSRGQGWDSDEEDYEEMVMDYIVFGASDDTGHHHSSDTIHGSSMNHRNAMSNHNAIHEHSDGTGRMASSVGGASLRPHSVGKKHLIDWSHFSGMRPSKAIFARPCGFGCGLDQSRRTSQAIQGASSLGASMVSDRGGGGGSCAGTSSRRDLSGDTEMVGSPINEIRGLDEDDDDEEEDQEQVTMSVMAGSGSSSSSSSSSSSQSAFDHRMSDQSLISSALAVPLASQVCRPLVHPSKAVESLLGKTEDTSIDDCLSKTNNNDDEDENGANSKDCAKDWNDYGRNNDDDDWKELSCVRRMKDDKSYLLFLKYFDVYEQSMSILGSVIVSEDATLSDVACLIKAIAGWNPSREIEMWEEEDALKCKINALSLSQSLKDAQLVDGDIIVFQEKSALSPFMKLPSARKFLEDLASEEAADTRRATAQPL